jgi:purine-binding chemotaxis protein CheW
MSNETTVEDDLFLEADDDVQENKFLMCRLEEEVYGIDIRFVTDILERQKITEIPDMPDYVRGVINLRGHVIPVMDLRLRFGMPFHEYDNRTVITVVNIQEMSIGFIVDTATEVKEIPDQNIEPSPSFETRAEKHDFIAGLGKVDDTIIILLDIDKLVAREEIAALSHA